MTDPLVSVVIPHFERPRLLRETVGSVLQSSESRFEVIIVDDGSSESCWREIRSLEDAHVRVVRRVDGPKGPSRCRNLGLALARAELVVFLDSDDLMAPWCLSSRLNSSRAFPEMDFWVFPALLFNHQPGDMDMLWNAMDIGVDPALRFVQSDPAWHTSSPLWKRSALTSIGGFNEAIIYGDDSDLHLRALLSGKKFVLFPDESPDLFVRRSDVPRITNSLDPELVESRRLRLREGTRFLASSAGFSRLLDLWQTQYFFEMEFLLFNLSEPEEPLRRIVSDWETACQPPRAMRALIRSYLRVGRLGVRHAYILIRAARRLMMAVLPPEYFHRPPEDNSSARLSSTDFAAFHQRLRAASAGRLAGSR